MAPLIARTFTFRALVQGALLALGGLALLLYILWQARFMIAGPQISLAEEPPRVSNERFVTLRGEVRNITTITLNGRQIFTDPHGNFNEALPLENGYTIATIAATDRYGRTTRLERSFMYTPASILDTSTN
jgi:hypothetical protein